MEFLAWAFLALAPCFVDSTAIGYSNSTPSTVTSSSLSFGAHYAVLNLDLINAFVRSINATSKGQAFIKNTAKWIDAVHKQSPPPISIFSRLYTSNSLMPEISTCSPFRSTIADLGNITESDVESHLYQAFKPLSDCDVVLQKTRYYAGAENTLVQILRNHKINTIVLSGLRTSGVLLTTAQRLFDLDFNVYVIANNTIEMGSDAAMIYDAILQGILPKMPLNVITVEQAIDALSRSKVAYQ